MNKLLIIDCQLFQNTTVNRGMGRYSLCLLEALKSTSFFIDYNVKLMLNDSLPFEKASSILESIIPNVEQIHFFLPYSKLKKRNDYTNSRSTLDSELKKNKIISCDFFILSNFEIFQSISVFPSSAENKYLLMYDLIPYLFHKHYLTNEENRAEYLIRFRSIFEATHIFTISNSTRNDLITYLGITKNKIENIGGAPISDNNVQFEKYSNLNKYILFPTGNEWRKNNQRVFEAFRASKVSRSHKLVVTSDFDQQSIVSAQKISRNIIFTGYISNPKLNWLFQNCSAVIFPSLYEGLGLPLIEAAQYNKPIVASDIPVFNEISGDFIFCDPYQTESITTAITKSCKYDSEIQYFISENFVSWSKTASRLLNFSRKLFNSDIASIKKTAVLGPDPSGYSAIGKMMQELLPHLAPIDYVTYFQEPIPNQEVLRVSYVSYVWETKDVSEIFSCSIEFSEVIVNIGNSEHHCLSYLYAISHSSTVIIHDLNLKGLFTTLSGRLPSFIERMKLEKEFDALIKLKEPAQYLSSLLYRSRKVVVHSKYAKKLLTKCNLNLNTIIDSNLAVPESVPNIASSLGQVIVGIAGIIHESKLVDEVIESCLKKSNVLVYVFGFSFGDIYTKRIKEYTDTGKVFIFTNTSDFEFQTLISKLDYLVNLRSSYNGETSRTVLEALRYGVHPIVINVGWFKELATECKSVVTLNDCSELDSLELSKQINYNDDTIESFINEHSYNKYCSDLYREV